MPSPSESFDAPYLFRTHTGWVMRCSCCGKLEVVFGNGVLSVTDAEFACLLRTVKRLEAEFEAHGPHSRCRLRAGSGACSLYLELGLHQIRALSDLRLVAAAPPISYVQPSQTRPAPDVCPV